MKKFSRIGLFGGSFNPIHKSHLQLALDAKKEFNLNKVIFIPANIPPHKKNSILANSKDRISMVELAIANYPSFALSKHEINKKGVSYSVNTVKFFKNKYPLSEIFLLIGSDSLNELNTWKNIKKLTSLCTFIAALRKGNKIHKNNKYLKNTLLTKHALPDISSSKIRTMAKNGLSLNQYVPEKVGKYISKRGLYR